MAKPVFVFSSNEAGIHGAGAARTAYQKHGARWGFSYGHQGDSFAIPTKDSELEPLGLHRVKQYVDGFLAFAAGHRRLDFHISRVGCGLAGFTDQQIAPLFKAASFNCHFDEAWKPILGPLHNYWETF